MEIFFSFSYNYINSAAYVNYTFFICYMSVHWELLPTAHSHSLPLKITTYNGYKAFPAFEYKNWQNFADLVPKLEQWEAVIFINCDSSLITCYPNVSISLNCGWLFELVLAERSDHPPPPPPVLPLWWTLISIWFRPNPEHSLWNRAWILMIRNSRYVKTAFLSVIIQHDYKNVWALYSTHSFMISETVLLLTWPLILWFYSELCVFQVHLPQHRSRWDIP